MLRLGEISASFPSGSGEHRLNLLKAIFGPLLAGRDFTGPGALYGHLSARTRVLSLQAGELGPVAQCVCGFDIAARDLVARLEALTLREALGGQVCEAAGRSRRRASVYSSQPWRPSWLPNWR